MFQSFKVSIGKELQQLLESDQRTRTSLGFQHCLLLAPIVVQKLFVLGADVLFPSTFSPESRAKINRLAAPRLPKRVYVQRALEKVVHIEILITTSVLPDEFFWPMQGFKIGETTQPLFQLGYELNVDGEIIGGPFLD